MIGGDSIALIFVIPSRAENRYDSYLFISYLIPLSINSFCFFRKFAGKKIKKKTKETIKIENFWKLRTLSFWCVFRFTFCLSRWDKKGGGPLDPWINILGFGLEASFLLWTWIADYDVDFFHSIPFHAMLFYFTLIFSLCNFHCILFIYFYLLIHFFLKNCREIIEKERQKLLVK